MSLPSISSGFLQNVYSESSVKKHRLGTLLDMGDGRVFRYARAGGTALAAGKLCAAAAAGSDHVRNLAVAAAAAIGATSITITNGGTTAITKDMLQDGFIFIDLADGIGQCRRIKSNTAAATGASCVITLYENEALTEALTTSSKVGIRVNPYAAVVVAPTSTVAPVVGLSGMAVTANYYFWMQVSGYAAVRTNGTVVVGNPVTRSGTTAGSVDACATDSILAVVGIIVQVASTAEASLIDLKLL